MTDYEAGGTEDGFDWSSNLQTWLHKGRMVLKKFWWIPILTTCATAAYKAYDTHKVPPQYISSAQMIVSDRATVPESDAIRMEYANFFGTQIALMQSGRVRQWAADRVAQLHPDVKGSWPSIRAYQRPNTSIFIIEATGRQREYTQLFLEAVLDGYMDFRRELREDAADRALISITQEIMRLNEQVSEQEVALEAFRKKNSIVSIREQDNLAAQFLAELKRDEANLQTQLRLLETLAIDDQLLADVQSEDDPIMELINLDLSEQYRQKKLQQDQLRAELRSFSEYLTDRHPKIIRFKDEIARMGVELRAIREQGQEQLEEKRRILNTRLRNVRQNIEEWNKRALEFSRLLAEYERLNSSLNDMRSTSQRFQESVQFINRGTQLMQSPVRKLEGASAPREQRPSVTKNATQGGIFGLAVGVGLLVCIGALDNRIISTEDVKQRFDLPILGIIPFEKSKGVDNVRPLAESDTRHLFAEACRTLRSSILFMDCEGARPRTMIITSAVPGEGKSTIASNLGITLAHAASRTVVVDADLRRGYMHDTFQCAKDPGLTDYLLGEANLDAIIKPSGVRNLDIITRGKNYERPGELLLSREMERMLSELRERYDFIIFDTAPVLATDDTTSFAPRIDGVIFTVRSTLTQARQVTSALDRLQVRGGRMLGFVVNCVNTRSTDYYYYNKYNNYYTYAPQREPLPADTAETNG